MNALGFTGPDGKKLPENGKLDLNTVVAYDSMIHNGSFFGNAGSPISQALGGKNAAPKMSWTEQQRQQALQSALLATVNTAEREKAAAKAEAQRQNTAALGPDGDQERGYWEKTGRKLLLGNYAQEEGTGLSLAAQIALGMVGADLPLDIRDLSYDLTHWESTPDHVTQTLVDVIALLPAVGALKYVDEAASVAKHGDELAEAAKGAGKYIDNTADALTQGEKLVINDLVRQGKTVERIPVNPKIGGGTPDFKVDGVTTELKTLENANTNTGMKRVQNGFSQGAEIVIIDARKSGLTKAQAEEIIARTKGKYVNEELPGTVEIWIDGQVIIYP